MSISVPAHLGRYEVVGFLAAGGMAELFLGRTQGPHGFSRPVVLKRILPHLARQQSFVDMFLDEARIVARIHHPNVVAVNELTHEAGELFMAMEYLEGESAAGLVRRLVSRNEALDPFIAAHVVAEACAGLHAAHELLGDDGASLGVVHRDVSPQNLFVTFDGSIKVLDFGIATAADRVTRTEAGQVKGKLDYMAPEQCTGGVVDRRTDVFALGVVLYELLTLRRLFKRPTALATMRAITQEPVVPPSRVRAECPPELERVCLKALGRDPAARFQTAAELRRELAKVLSTAAGALPEERTGQLMQRLFAERRAEKEEMLRRVKEGSRPTQIPAADIDVAVEIPEAPHAQLTPAVPVPVASPPRRLGLWAALGVGLAATLGLAVWLGAPGAPRTHAPPSPAVEPAVKIRIESQPSGARVMAGELELGETPLELERPRGVTVDVSIALRGFATARQVLSFERPSTVAVVLSPVQPAPSTPLKADPRRKPKPGASDPLQEKW